VADARVVIVTGMSGAGRSQTAKVLEDVGYFVVDNLPPGLITQVVDGAGILEGGRDRMALVVDTRGRLTEEDLNAALLGLDSRGIRSTVLFLDADDATLVRRFEETRRTHPVAEGRLAEKIATERASFEDIRGGADIIIDTTDLDVHQLRRQLETAFAGELPERQMRVDILSFGFKRGVPRVVDVMFDVRFLPNPHWVAELRPLTGLDEAVRDYVLAQPDSQEFLAQVKRMLHFLIPRYAAEGKSYLTIGIGCTGGRHRSVVLSNEIGQIVADLGEVEVTVGHRDLPGAGS
jgi:UPF0042 nucleotide-binding protein